MNRIRTFSLVAGLLVTGWTAAAAAQSRPTLIRDARLFDGQAVVERASVLVRDGKIAAVGRTVRAPAGAEIVDGRGKTLLPGLIDSHTHSFGDALRSALVFGVTTELDMFTQVQMASTIKADQAAGRRLDEADLRTAGTLVTAPGGHGTEYGMTIPTISAPEEAQAFVDARIAEGSDYIKIVYDDAKSYGRNIPTISRATMAAVIQAAHRRGKLAVVHISTIGAARDAIESGADGLVHLFIDRAPDAAFAPLVAGKRAFVIPTLTVLESVTGSGGGAALADHPGVAPYLAEPAAGSLRRGFPVRPGGSNRYEYAEQTVRELRAAGVPILAGTDAPNPGTAHGASLHRELELLVKAGLSPLQALASATSVPAKAFALTDRGRIAPGLRADLLLVEGDPTSDVAGTRDIVRVWKVGVPVDRDGYRAALASVKHASLQAPAALGGSDLVSDFEGSTPAASFGLGWDVSTDAIAGGKSTGKIAITPDGASASKGSLGVTGTIAGDLPYAWAGAIYYPGSAPMTPVDLSSRKEIRFRAKGDGKTYRIMVFAQSRGMMPLVRTFVAGPEWKEHVFPFSAFEGIDGRDVMAILWGGGPEPGTFSFQIDDVKLAGGS